MKAKAKQLDPNAWIKKQLKPRRGKRAVAPKKGPRADYGRRVRNMTIDSGVVATTAVLPHTGPKPYEYPKVDYTPLAWRVG